MPAPDPVIGSDPWGDVANARFDDLQTQIDAVTGGVSGFVRSRTYGLGLGVPDPGALQAMFNDLVNNFAEAGLTQNTPLTTGAHGQISSGLWNVDPLGHVIMAPNSHGFDVTVSGEVAGGTTLFAPDRGNVPGGSSNCGAMGSRQNIASATWDGANTFTLQLAAPWFDTTGSTGIQTPWQGAVPNSANPICSLNDPIVVQVPSRGVPRWAHFSVSANNVGGDYTKIQYQAYDPVKTHTYSGHVINTTGPSSACIPISQATASLYTSTGYPALGYAYFPACMLQFLGFKVPHRGRLSDIVLQSGSSTETPLDGIGIRRGSGNTLNGGVHLSGFWANEMLNGTAMGYGDPNYDWVTPAGPRTIIPGTNQNTDHTFSQAYYENGTNNLLVMANSAAAWPNSNPAPAGIGGGRDNHWNGASFGSPGLYHVVIADDGSLESGDFDKANFKSGISMFHGEGVAGVACTESNMIDGLTGWFKTEAAGNLVWDDESKTRQLWSFQNVAQRMAASISIDGSGNVNNFTDQPYTLGTLTLSGSGNGTRPTTTVGTGAALPQATIVSSGTITQAPTVGGFINPSGDVPLGLLAIPTTAGLQLVAYTGITGANFTGCRGGVGTMVSGASITQIPAVSGQVTGPTAGITGNAFEVGTQIQIGNAGPTTHSAYSVATDLAGIGTLHVTPGTVAAFSVPGELGVTSSRGNQAVDYTGTTIGGTLLTAVSTTVATSVFNKTAHGLANGTAFMVSATGNGFTSGKVYFVVNTAANTFKGAAIKGGTAIVMTGTGASGLTISSPDAFTGCTGGGAEGSTITASLVTANTFNLETILAFFSPDWSTFTGPVSDYEYGDVTTGTTGTAGYIAFMRAGAFNRFEFQPDFGVQAADETTIASMFFDLCTLGPGRMAFTQDNISTGTTRSLPSFRVRDAEQLGGTLGLCSTSLSLYGTTYFNVFSSPETEFNQSDVGKVITTTGGAGVAGGSDTIAGFIDCHNVCMQGVVTAGTSSTWAMRDISNLDDPRVEIIRGMNKWEVVYRLGTVGSPSDTNNIQFGGVVESLTSPHGTRKVRASVGSKLVLCPGVAMTPSPTGGRVAVSVGTGTGAQARTYLASPTILIARPGSTITDGDDPQMVAVTSGASITAGTLLVDNGVTSPGTVVGPTLSVAGIPVAGQRVIGQAVKDASGGFVSARLCTPYFTEGNPRVVELKVLDDASALSATGTGLLIFCVPTAFAGMKLQTADAFFSTAAGGLTTIGVSDVTSGFNMLTTDIAIGSGQPTSYTGSGSASGVIAGAGHAIVSAGDLISINCSAFGTGPTGIGLGVILTFQ